ncbi:hypothetical protein GCM10023201_53770 [Actinomycetospora corticicola]|uniref:Uncharacterized protein n=1 Tax=Actinomycetospora corticicola TaxID=663602 RepID=A0A7Y9J7T6_9PSEU|nr:hypothetical protein [Actinomycetospora corticicola]NYD38558.1 hypothetical protein [Actinomycetospora corticicola]
MALFEFTGTLDGSDYTPVATGHVAAVMQWEDTANGRRPGSTPEVDEVTGARVYVADVMLPLGRDGRPELFGVRFAAADEPEFAPYAPVELVGLRVKVRASRTGKGVDVSFTANAVRPAGPQRTGRRSAEQTEAA